MQPIRFIDVPQRRNFRVGTVLVFLVGLSVLRSGQTMQRLPADDSVHRAAAAFGMRPANTPERQATLARLPANRFVHLVQGEHGNYSCTPPIVCGRLFVGSQQDNAGYKRRQAEQTPADEQPTTAQMYAPASED